MVDIDEAFAQALGDRPLWRVEDLKNMTHPESGYDARLWKCERSALFCRFDTYPNGERCVEIGPACGELTDILSHVPQIEAWARDRGATQAHVWTGRKGWARALAPQGYDVFSTVLRKLL